MKSKKAIKKLKATTEQPCQMYKDMYADIQSQIEILFNERLSVKASIERLNSLVNAKNGKIDALSNKLGNLKSDFENHKHSLLDIAVSKLFESVQNLEAEKCSCHIEKPKAEFDKELFGKLFTENFQEESKQVTIDAINQAVYSGHSIIDIMEKYTRNAVVNATTKTVADIAIHTNIQKTEKNVTERQGEGENGYSEVPSILDMDIERGLCNPDGSHTELGAKLIREAYDNNKQYFKKPKPETASELSPAQIREAVTNVISLPDSATIEMLRKDLPNEVIITNEMFNDELEKRLSESFIQDHPAFMLLNGFIPSNTIEDLIRAKLKSKGEHYSPNGDRYSNFKRLNGVSFKKKSVPERIENFMEKHEIWIEDYQAGDVSGTLLDLIESCVDVLCYYLLLDVYLKFNPESKNG